MAKNIRKITKSAFDLEAVESESNIISLGKQLKCLICKGSLNDNLHTLVKYEFKTSTKLRYKCLLSTSEGYAIEFTASKESFKEAKSQLSKEEIRKEDLARNDQQAILNSKSAIVKESNVIYNKVPDIVIYIQQPKALSTSEYFSEQLVIEEKKNKGFFDHDHSKKEKDKPYETFSTIPKYLKKRGALYDKIENITINCPECGMEFSHLDKKNFANHVKNHAKKKYLINNSDSFEKSLILKEINFNLNK